MRYLALGDSMSIDLYTGVMGGGAASQFAARFPAGSFQDMARDGATTHDVLQLMQDWRSWTAHPRYDVITLTVGGNDLLAAAVTSRTPATADVWRERANAVALNLSKIAGTLLGLGVGGRIVFNTVYDPTDGDDTRLLEIGLPLESHVGLETYNQKVRDLVKGLSVISRRIMLCDAYALFQGHGYWSRDPWITQMIEPNLAGATALADAWLALVASAP